MGAAAVWIQGAMVAVVPGNAVLAQTLRLGASIGGAVGVLVLVAYLLRIKELHEGIDLVLRRFRRRAR
jgi:hypothetical protein